MSIKNLDALTEVELAYLAGIVDGEGCIHIGYQHSKTSTYHTLFLKVATTDYRLMLWLDDRLGGCLKKRTLCASNRRDVWSWEVASRQAEAVIRKIIPYLVIKKDQAELAIRFRESFVGLKPHKNSPLPENVVEFRSSCYQEMRDLKKPKSSVEVA